MKSIDSSFYKSRAWKGCRSEYLRLHPLCEECLKNGIYTPASHVHHKIFLNNDNVNDPSVSLNFDNLEAVCMECHNRIHFSKGKKRYMTDDLGRVIGID